MHERGIDPEVVQRMAAEVFRHCVLKLIACQKGCQTQEEVATLRQWEIMAWQTGARPGEEKFTPRWTRRILAYQIAKEELRNPENLRALLASKISHTPDLGEHSLKSSLPHCTKCGGEVDHVKRHALLERIQKGFRLRQLDNPCEAEQLIGTHLTEQEVFGFAGYEVNFARVERFVEQCESDVSKIVL